MDPVSSDSNSCAQLSLHPGELLLVLALARPDLASVLEVRVEARRVQRRPAAGLLRLHGVTEAVGGLLLGDVALQREPREERHVEARDHRGARTLGLADLLWALNALELLDLGGSRDFVEFTVAWTRKFDYPAIRKECVTLESSTAYPIALKHD